MSTNNDQYAQYVNKYGQSLMTASVSLSAH